MSHKATAWLAGIPAQDLSSSEFRILFRLCDCHNPSKGCFPTQAFLIDTTGVSNGTLNNVLNALVAKGLIARHRSFDGATKRQKPTRYTFAFEDDFRPPARRQNGALNLPDPSPETGDGADSNMDPDPSPISTPTRLQPTGEVTCKEPVNNQRVCARGDDFSPEIVKAAVFWAEKIEAGKFIPETGIGAQVARCMIAKKMITTSQANAHGLT